MSRQEGLKSSSDQYSTESGVYKAVSSGSNIREAVNHDGGRSY